MVFGAVPTGHRLHRIRRSPHFTAGALRNLVPTSVIRPGSWMRVLAAQLSGLPGRRPDRPVPVRRLSANDLAAPPRTGVRVTWLGHASVLAELGSRRVLFDPVWSRRCLPIPFAGPKRLHPAPIAAPELAQLPIDVVAISHDHYDHLDMTAVQTLATATLATFVVPLGVGAHLERWGVPAERIIEHDWHEQTQINGLTLTATPARHHSGRGPRREPEVHWCSWAATDGTHRIFHGGDSGYFTDLRDIGAAYGPFDVTMIGVGAYNDLWPDVHMTPEQAVTAHRDLRGGAMLPIHWGTYPLAPHPWAEPIERTLTAAQATGDQLLVPPPGQPVEPAHARPAHRCIRWWRADRPIQAEANVLAVPDSRPNPRVTVP